MYKIFRGGQVVATVSAIRTADNDAVSAGASYVKRHPHDENLFVLATKEDAEGISVQALSQVFALMGHEIDGLEQVVVQEADGGAMIDRLDETCRYLADVIGVDISPPIESPESGENGEAVVQAELYELAVLAPILDRLKILEQKIEELRIRHF